ncbi:MAG: hydrolase [Legionellaceae bacterium]
MDKETTAILQTLKAKEPVMIEQLITWSHINSGSTHLKGLHRMREALRDVFLPVMDTCEQHTLPPIQTLTLSGEEKQQLTGDLLFLRKRPSLKRRILLTGHMDTVFDEHHPFQTPVMLHENTLNGPGVADMKGGLVVMLHALTAFETLPIAQTLGYDIILNADEELGSPASSHFFETITHPYEAAFVYEPAMDSEGTLAKNRKGSGKLTLIATGKTAHAGRDFYEGRNAIVYLAEVIVALHALNEQQEGITLNIGQIRGGEALNVVPDQALIKIDVRITQPSDEHWVREQIKIIFDRFKRPDYTLTLHGDFARPVKRVDTPTVALFERAHIVGQKLGLNLTWKDSGGCCDGNNLARLGLPVLDTLGVRGGNIHSQHEFVLLDSLVERAALTALLMQDIAEQGLSS